MSTLSRGGGYVTGRGTMDGTNAQRGSSSGHGSQQTALGGLTEVQEVHAERWAGSQTPEGSSVVAVSPALWSGTQAHAPRRAAGTSASPALCRRHLRSSGLRTGGHRPLPFRILHPAHHQTVRAPCLVMQLHADTGHPPRLPAWPEHIPIRRPAPTLVPYSCVTTWQTGCCCSNVNRNTWLLCPQPFTGRRLAQREPLSAGGTATC